MADYGIRRYRLGNALMSRALLEGFTVQGDALHIDTPVHGGYSVFFPGLDSVQPDCAWGRISLKCRLEPESMLTIRAFASDQDMVIRNQDMVRVDDFLLDPEVPRAEKERLFQKLSLMPYMKVQGFSLRR